MWHCRVSCGAMGCHLDAMYDAACDAACDATTMPCVMPRVMICAMLCVMPFCRGRPKWRSLTWRRLIWRRFTTLSPRLCSPPVMAPLRLYAWILGLTVGITSQTGRHIQGSCTARIHACGDVHPKRQTRNHELGLGLHVYCCIRVEEG